MGQGIYVASDAGYITPDVNFLEEVFPELLGVEVQGVQWNDVDSKLFTVMMLQQHYAKLLELVYIADLTKKSNGLLFFLSPIYL